MPPFRSRSHAPLPKLSDCHWHQPFPLAVSPPKLFRCHWHQPLAHSLPPPSPPVAVAKGARGLHFGDFKNHIQLQVLPILGTVGSNTLWIHERFFPMGGRRRCCLVTKVLVFTCRQQGSCRPTHRAQGVEGCMGARFGLLTALFRVVLSNLWYACGAGMRPERHAALYCSKPRRTWFRHCTALRVCDASSC